MRIVSAADLAGIFSFPELVETLRSAFRREVVTPVRHHHEITISGEPAAMLLLMPAWDDFSPQSLPHKGHLGVNVVSSIPAMRRAAGRATPALVS